MKNGHKNPMLRWQMCNEWKIQFPNPLFRSPPPFCFILLNKRNLKNNCEHFLNTLLKTFPVKPKVWSKLFGFVSEVRANYK